MKSLSLFLLSAVIALSSCAQSNSQKKDAIAKQYWVDSIYNSLSQKERIGQLFMVAAYSGGKNFNQPQIEQLIRNHQIGGLIFMQGGAGRQATLTNRYQQMAQVPMLIAMDAEWGLGMRLDSVINFPHQMLIGASRDTALAYVLGMSVAYQCKRLGVHINFAPVVDVNNNPNNPIINARSFGEDKKWVTRLAKAYMDGMQDYGVMACAKHFPGHGDVSVDSHKDLPVITKSLAQLDTLELYPFREMIRDGIQSIMVAHLSIPAIEKEPNVPTTLSKNTVTGLLKGKMGFKGLIFTDALNMQGVAKYFPAGEADYRAFTAGCDVLLFSQDVPTAIAKISEGLRTSKITEADLEERVKKILAAKYDAGLSKPQHIEVEYITNDINQYTAAYNAKAAEAALTLVRSEGNFHQRLNKPGGTVAYVSVNGKLDPAVLQLLKSRIANVTIYELSKNAQNVSFLGQLSKYDAVIVGVHGISFYPNNNYGLNDMQRNFLNQMQNMQNVAVAIMGNAYAAKYACYAPTLYLAYEDNKWTQAALIKALTGELKPKGILPVTPTCLK